MRATCWLSLWLAPLVTASLYACASDQAEAPALSGIDVPPGFPEPRIPATHPATRAMAELGRHLFHDRRLSGNASQSCASCHAQALAFTDGRAVAVGSTGQAHARNSPTLTNVVYNATLNWANPILTELEQHLLVPLFGEDPVELGATGRQSEILALVRNDDRYRDLFAQAFLGQTPAVDWDNIIRALAAFVRTLISGDSAFDRFVYQDDAQALSAAARRGMELFYSERLECHHCHGGFNFTESSVHAGSVFSAERFHNTGLYNIDSAGAYPANNTGLYEITGRPSDMGRFRPPTLRNVGVTAPYMHDGSIATLEEVVRFYEAGGRLIIEGPNAGDGRVNPYKSGLVAGFTLAETERADLLEFLDALTDHRFLADPRFSDPFSPGAP